MAATIATEFLQEMKKTSIFKTLSMTAAALSVALFSSCNDAIYDEEGDCDSHFYVCFKFDYNMNSADAFPSEVKQVTLHLADADGNIVWKNTESGAALAAEGYRMEVDVVPGTYTLMAWCSSENPETFTVGEGNSLDNRKVSFNTETDPDGSLHIRHDYDLDRLYHGYEANVTFPNLEGEDYTHLLPLIKDTNHITIELQQLSGEPLDKDLIEFEIIDDNAHLNWDNNPILGRPVTYHEWHKENVNADLGTKAVDNNTHTGVVADLTVSRLMENHRADSKLKIYRTDTGEEIVSIRLIDALLLVKGYYNRHWSDQEYLDRKDEYPLIFFLDENHEWLDGVIKIESWRVVYQEHDLD